MPKKKTRNRLPASTRAKILAEAGAKGLTAEQVEKKYGVSKWTYYGWKKRAGKPAARALGRASSKAVSGIGAGAVRAEIRAILPGILREEMARALGNLFGGVKRPRR